MERSRLGRVFILTGVLLSCAVAAGAQIEIGNTVVSGGAEVYGLPGRHTGHDAKFEEYRDIPIGGAVLQDLQLMIGGKREDFFLELGTSKPGLDDQNFRLRFGRYGLLDIELEWDQTPHWFSHNIARTPYSRNDGDYTLATKPASTAGTAVRDWVNADSRPLNLKLLNRVGRANLRYTPSPGWTFGLGFSSQLVEGKRAIGALFGSSPGAYNITELPEPIDYQTHNIELGGTYAGNGWSLGLKYNGSIFHNSVSTLTWDNPLNPGVGGACTNEATYNGATGAGPCRGRMDLYPSNQAHSFMLSGVAVLPMKSRFLGTVSYGWRRQNDDFLPFTINPAITSPDLPRRSLDGDVRPLMINATLVNNFFNRVDLKVFYRLFDLDNRSKRLLFEDGIVALDQSPSADCVTDGNCVQQGLASFPYEYTKHNVGFDAGYDVTRSLSAKFSYLWEKMHREGREVINANEHSFGPTFDVKPNHWSLFRLSYRHSRRDDDGYDAAHNIVIHTEATPEELREEYLEELRKFDEAARVRNKVSLFTQISPLQNLTFHAAFDVIVDRFPHTPIGLKADNNYSPSIGFIYQPLDWLSLFGDYNFEYFDWKMKAIERNNIAQTPQANPDRIWSSRGIDKINTVMFGGDFKLIPNLLGLRLQYSFSDARSEARATGSTCAGCTPATDYPNIVTNWHELLARFEYQLHKNVALRFGYYFNRFRQKDHGVDIMKPWMGDVDTGANVQRSIFLGDRIKGDYTAHIGFLGLKLRF